MTTERYFLWTALTIIWFAAACAVQYSLRKRCRIRTRVVLIIVKLLLSFAVACLIMAVNLPFVYRFGFELAPLYIVLFADAVGDILTLPMIINQQKEKTNHNRTQIIVSAVCTVIYLVYGTVNMQTIRANRFSVTSDKLTKSHRVIFAADFHVGSAQSISTFESAIRKIDEENADLVLLGGDIIDEFTTKEEMEQTFSLLGSIKAPVYFIYGNHDLQPMRKAVSGNPALTQTELESAMISNGIEILKDQFAQISDDLVVFGRLDITIDDRKPSSEISGRLDNAFVLSVDHSPYKTEDIIESGADLQLSGHTHAGQLFPLQALIKLKGLDAYGFSRHGNTDVYVSSGASGWCFPFRTEEGCHYEVITLEPIN